MSHGSTLHTVGRGRVFILCAAGLAFATLASPQTGQTGDGPSKIPDADRAIIHVLNRLGYGARPGDLERVRQVGVAAYIEQQLHPDRLTDASLAVRLDRLTTIGMSPRELAESYYIPTGQRPESIVMSELSEERLLRAIYSERQLEEVLVDFWFNHFNVFAGKGVARLYVPEYERRVIRSHALGRFRDLLGAVAQSPAMLLYLDNWRSSDPASADDPVGGRRSARRGSIFGGRWRAMPRDTVRDDGNQVQRRLQSRGLNENYARELMELHTIGVDGGYTQKDVVEVARAFTGWTIDGLRTGGGFRFDPAMHDDREKVVLGQVIKAGGGRSDGERVLDILARHPSTARSIATKLSTRFVSDDPPPSLIERAAARFRDTDGDIRAVVRDIVTAPEFFAQEAYRAKVKTPLEFVAGAARATGASVDNAFSLASALRGLGMPLYYSLPPTGYADRADAWVNTGALLERMNFAVALVSGRLKGVTVDLSALAGGNDLPAVRRRLVDAILQNEASPATREMLDKGADLTQIAALAIGSPEFQKK